MRKIAALPVAYLRNRTSTQNEITLSHLVACTITRALQGAVENATADKSPKSTLSFSHTEWAF